MRLTDGSFQDGGSKFPPFAAGGDGLQALTRLISSSPAPGLFDTEAELLADEKLHTSADKAT